MTHKTGKLGHIDVDEEAHVNAPVQPISFMPLYEDEVTIVDHGFDPAKLHGDKTVIAKAFGLRAGFVATAKFTANVKFATKSMREFIAIMSPTVAAGFYIANRRGRNRLVRIMRKK